MMSSQVRCFSCKQMGHFARACPSRQVQTGTVDKTKGDQFFRVCERMVDIGANLTKRDFAKDVTGLLRRSKQNNVNQIIITGTSVKSSQQAINFVKKHQNTMQEVTLYSTVGIHPHDASTFTEDSVDKLRSLSREMGVVAIGECGLDYNRMFSTKEQQTNCFRQHIELAKEMSMPLFCHERDAHEDFVEITQEFKDLPPLVVHCFTGTRSEIIKYVELGYYVGFTGTICMQQRGQHLRDILTEKIVPLNRLMIETDAPFMSPVRSIRKNEPAMLGHVCKTLAESYGITPEEMAAITTQNANEFFSLTV